MDSLKTTNARVWERKAKAVLLLSLRTEMRVVRTLLFLATGEDGEKRLHHLKRARIAFQELRKLATRVRPTKIDLIEIEMLRQGVLSLTTTSLPPRQ